MVGETHINQPPEQKDKQQESKWKKWKDSVHADGESDNAIKEQRLWGNTRIPYSPNIGLNPDSKQEKRDLCSARWERFSGGRSHE